jgi:hypothetical protein
MIRENLEAEWINISEKLMNRFPRLNHTDLVLVKGKEEEMIEKICLRLNKTRDAVIVLISSL